MSEAESSDAGVGPTPLGGQQASGRPVLGRRLFVLNVMAGALAFTVGPSILEVETAAQAQCSGVSDSDPNDPAGCGRRVRTGVTDNDPNDPAGSGRGRRGVVRTRRTGVTDNDPTDPVGAGRGLRRGRVARPVPARPVRPPPRVVRPAPTRRAAPTRPAITRPITRPAPRAPAPRAPAPRAPAPAPRAPSVPYSPGGGGRSV